MLSVGHMAASHVNQPSYTILKEYAPQVYYRLSEASGSVVNSGALSSHNGAATSVTYGATKIASASESTAISFNGSTSKIDITDGAFGGTVFDFSIGFWFKTSASSGRIFQQLDSTSDLGTYFVEINGGAIHFLAKVLDGTTDVDLTTSGSSLADGNAHHVGITMTAGSCAIFIDGNLNASGSRVATTPTFVSARDMSIGYDRATATNYYTGTLSDIFVSLLALSLDDWRKIYRRGTANATSPANDNLNDALVLSTGTSGSVSLSNVGAYMEPGEPQHSNSTKHNTSVWMKYVPAASGPILFTGGTTNHVLDVYQGTTLAGLSLLGSTFGFPSTSLNVPGLVAGTTYYICMSGFTGATGTLSLTWAVGTTPPANDDFANAQLFSTASSGTITTGTTVGATIESGEPDPHGLLSSVWFKFVASSTGNITLDTDGGGTLDTILTVFTGSSVGSLVQIGTDDDSGTGFTSLLTVAVTSGTTYHVQIQDYDGGGVFHLNWTAITP